MSDGRSRSPRRAWRDRRRRSFPALDLLTAFLVVLTLLPARLVLPTLGGLGRPAVLIGLVCGLSWVLSRLARGSVPEGRQPVRWALLVYFSVFLVTYAFGHERGLSGNEVRATDRALVLAVSMLGVALLAADGIRSRHDLDRLLRRLIVLVGVVAFVGMLQFWPGIDLPTMVRIPGLSLNRELSEIGTRGAPAFARVKGTATHPLEFGVLMAMTLPIAVHYGLFAHSRRERILRWSLVSIIGVSILFSLSRSGVLGLFVGMGVLWLVWTDRIRIEALAAAVASAVAVRSVIPGLIGTLRSLFANWGTDPSIQGRTDDYSIVGQFVSERPLLGRGPRTFLPEQYFALDNQFLNTLITMGWLGVVALAVLLLVPIGVARGVFRRGTSDETRHLAQALTASLAVAVATSFTFDSLAFAGFSGLLFVLIGSIGALQRLERQGDTVDADPWRRPTVRNGMARGEREAGSIRHRADRGGDDG